MDQIQFCILQRRMLNLHTMLSKLLIQLKRHYFKKKKVGRGYLFMNCKSLLALLLPKSSFLSCHPCSNYLAAFWLKNEVLIRKKISICFFFIYIIPVSWISVEICRFLANVCNTSGMFKSWNVTQSLIRFFSAFILNIKNKIGFANDYSLLFEPKKQITSWWPMLTLC